MLCYSCYFADYFLLLYTILYSFCYFNSLFITHMARSLTVYYLRTVELELTSARQKWKWKSLSVGVQTVTERLNKAEASVTDAFVTVSLSESLLSRTQKQRLNPLVIHVRSASKMPSTPVPFGELRTRCCTVFVVLLCFCFLRVCVLSLDTNSCRHLCFWKTPWNDFSEYFNV